MTATPIVQPKEPTPATPITAAAMGARHDRVDGPEKVTGRAEYAVEHPVEDPLYAWLVQSTTARGRVRAVDATEALAHPGVVSVVDHTSAPRMTPPEDGELDGELAILQEPAIGFRGQIVAVVLAESIEAAREGARLVRVHQEVEPHEVVMEGAETFVPDKVNGYTTATAVGDIDAAVAAAPVLVDEVYTTPFEHNSPMEPHAVTATWDGERLDLFDSTQAVHSVAQTISGLLGLAQADVRVRAPYVGGGFGSKGMPHSPEVAAALAAMTVPGRPVRLAVTRQQMFALCGYRTQTAQRFRLAAEPDGRLLGIDHETTLQSARIKEFAEQVGLATRSMYAAPDRRTGHRVASLDVAVTSWMRAPGEMPGVYAHEVAMDELAVRTGVDPVELRVRNEPDVDPESGLPFNDRRFVECLRRGAERFGWAGRPAEAAATVDGDWWVGTGVAMASYPGLWMPGNAARIVALGEGRYAVFIGAVDIGTGARTVLAQIAADALAVSVDDIELAIGDTDLPVATVAGGSAGTSSWGTAIVAGAQLFRRDHGEAPDAGAESTSLTEDYPDLEGYSMHSWGAVFAEARINRWTGEVRVPRLLGVYSVGRVINPQLAHSQLLGGLVMGLSAALHEESWRDPRMGHIVTQDLATYHVASHADIGRIEAEWLEESDTLLTPMGSRGIGEIGIVGTAAAVANATYHATGVRVRGLPLTADHFLDVRSPAR